MAADKKRELIAFNELKRVIIDPGFCTKCGACAAACPVHAIDIVQSELKYDDCSVYMDFCPICYDICPHTEPLITEAMRFVVDAPKRREVLGYYRKVVIARSADIELREGGHGGGVINAFLSHLLDTGVIDGAVMSETTSNAPLELQAVIGTVPDDAMSTVEIEFFPSAVAKAFGDAVRSFGKQKIAFVGVPHQVLALRKLEVWEHKIMNNLELTIGLYCLWTFSQNQMLEWLCKEYSINPHDITHLDLTDRFEIHTDKEKIRVPFSKILPFVMKRCHTCTDLTGEQADISIGTAYPLKDWSTVIIRTEKAERLFNDAVEKGKIEVRPIDESFDVFSHLIQLGNRKAAIAYKEIRRRKSAGEPIPPAMDRLMEKTPTEEF
ncbi:MAG: Coenzyme F420 hydrogenase/dehydrogenase, beta subunit C-terminal domain, partial [Candidatus Ranarchaeia archaeon]